MKATANLQAEKEQLIKNVQRINDGTLIQAIQSMIDYAKVRDEEYLGESIEEYNQKLDEAVAEIDDGKFIIHEDAVKKIGTWSEKEK